MELYQGQLGLSLRRFASYAGVAYHKLRDHQKRAPRRRERGRCRDKLYQAVKEAALKYPTYGYRLLHQELQLLGEQVGLHSVRRALSALDLSPPQPRKTRKKTSEVVPVHDWPQGRRVQIDATRLSLPDGVCWVYVVLDVETRVVLATRVVRGLSMHLAALTLDDAVRVLRQHGIRGSLLVQSDGGSDFTSEVFQAACRKYGVWVRAKVSQVGGMGVLERLNRTFKYEFAFRREWQSLGEVQRDLPEFEVWYNRQRRHSALSYATPWSTLTRTADARNAA